MLQLYWIFNIRFFMLYSGKSLLERVYPTAEMQSVYNTAHVTGLAMKIRKNAISSRQEWGLHN